MKIGHITTGIDTQTRPAPIGTSHHQHLGPAKTISAVSSEPTPANHQRQPQLLPRVQGYVPHSAAAPSPSSALGPGYSAKSSAGSYSKNGSMGANFPPSVVLHRQAGIIELRRKQHFRRSRHAQGRFWCFANMSAGRQCSARNVVITSASPIDATGMHLPPQSRYGKFALNTACSACAKASLAEILQTRA